MLDKGNNEMDQIYIDRLVTLAKHLATIPEQYFNLNNWAQGDVIPREYITKAGLTPNQVSRVTGKQLVEVNCGTTACALGWAAMIPEFRKDGLVLEVDVSIDSDYTGECNIDGHVWYNGYMDFEAAEVFFDLNEYHAEFVFHPISYLPGPKDTQEVIKHIARVLEIRCARIAAQTVRQLGEKL